VGIQTIDFLPFLSFCYPYGYTFTLLLMVLAIIIKALTLVTIILVKSTTTPTFDAVISLPTLTHNTCIHACSLQTIDSNKFNHSYTLVQTYMCFSRQFVISNPQFLHTNFSCIIMLMNILFIQPWFLTQRFKVDYGPWPKLCKIATVHSQFKKLVLLKLGFTTQ
jgi:hypothetical protein